MDVFAWHRGGREELHDSWVKPEQNGLSTRHAGSAGDTQPIRQAIDTQPTPHRPERNWPSEWRIDRTRIGRRSGKARPPRIARIIPHPGLDGLH